MGRRTQAERLLDELDLVERRIATERVRRGGLKAAVVAFAATFNHEPLTAAIGSRRRIRDLERERDRLLRAAARSAKSE